MRTFVHRNGLGIAVISIFLVMVAGQVASGWRVFNADGLQHGEASIGLLQYLATGHFFEAIFENWESEFFQMFAYIFLTAKLYQWGSPESKSLFEHNDVDDDPFEHRDHEHAPRVVRSGSALAVKLYSHSLSILFFGLWVMSFIFHAWSGARAYSNEELPHGEPAVAMWQYFTTSQFWFESFQNYQSEFMVLGVLVIASIWLREKGSTQSKPVHDSHREMESA